MNTKLLERLSKAAGSNFLEIERDKDTGEIIGIYVYRKGTMRKVMKIGGIDDDRLLGAICEKIEAEGWDWLKQARNLQIIDPDNNYKIIASTRLDDGLLAALALALCEALEAKQECPECNDAGEIEIGDAQFIDCPECNGSGEQDGNWGDYPFSACPACKGAGYTSTHIAGVPYNRTADCDQCNGTGKQQEVTQ